MATLAEMTHELVQVMDGAEQIRVKYNGSYENMTAEEDQQFERMIDRAEELKTAIKSVEGREARVKSMEALHEFAKQARPMLNLNGNGGGREEGGAAIKAVVDGEVDDLVIPRRSRDERAAWKMFWSGRSYSDFPPDAVKSLKGLNASDMAAGGGLVLPMELSTQILAAVKDLLFMRQIANVLPPLMKAESLGIPTLDTDLSDPTWTNELDTGSNDTVKPFGRRQLFPHPLAKRLRISKKLLRIAALDPEAFAMDRLAYRVARVQENAFLNGSGAQQPLGVFTGDANGIPATSTYDTTAANATTVVGDDFISVKHNLKVQYWGRARWVAHRNILGAVRKLKDSSNNYLWQPGLGGYVAQGTALIGGNPETILDCPIVMSELAPSTIATGQYTTILGDFSNYWIVDALDMTIERLMELYAETNEVGFILRMESDGAPVLAESFQRLKQA